MKNYCCKSYEGDLMPILHLMICVACYSTWDLKNVSEAVIICSGKVVLKRKLIYSVMVAKPKFIKSAKLDIFC